jgi:hypothetical protein
VVVHNDTNQVLKVDAGGNDSLLAYVVLAGTDRVVAYSGGTGPGVAGVTSVAARSFSEAIPAVAGTQSCTESGGAIPPGRYEVRAVVRFGNGIPNVSTTPATLTVRQR